MKIQVDAKRMARGLWWDRAWSLVEGCTPCAPECRNCWSAVASNMRQHNPNAKTRARYAGLMTSAGRFNGQVRFMESDLDKPLRTRKPTVWALWNDLFSEGVSSDCIDRAFAVMAHCPQHTFLVLTKRPGTAGEYFAGLNQRRRGYWHEQCGYLADVAIRAGLITEEEGANRYDQAVRRFKPELPEKPENLGDSSLYNPGWPLPNVGLGTTCGHPDSLWRVGELLKVPATFRFLSVEPLLAELNLKESWGDEWMYCRLCGYIATPGESFNTDGGPVDEPWAICPKCEGTNAGGYASYTQMDIIMNDDRPFPPVDQIIIGCESGPHRRPCRLEWVESLIDQADAAGVPVFVKQLDIDGRVTANMAEWPEWARRRMEP